MANRQEERTYLPDYQQEILSRMATYTNFMERRQPEEQEMTDLSSTPDCNCSRKRKHMTQCYTPEIHHILTSTRIDGKMSEDRFKEDYFPHTKSAMTTHQNSNELFMRHSTPVLSAKKKQPDAGKIFKFKGHTENCHLDYSSYESCDLSDSDDVFHESDTKVKNVDGDDSSSFGGIQVAPTLRYVYGSENAPVIVDRSSDSDSDNELEISSKHFTRSRLEPRASISVTSEAGKCAIRSSKGEAIIDFTISWAQYVSLSKHANDTIYEKSAKRARSTTDTGFPEVDIRLTIRKSSVCEKRPVYAKSYKNTFCKKIKVLKKMFQK